MCIVGIQPLSTVDYPGKLAYVIFIQGCNFKCGFCHNPELLAPNVKLLSRTEIYQDIEYRKNMVDAVVLSGGEPTNRPELLEILEDLKPFGLKLKLDTNGYHPDVIEKIIKRKLIDYIAMDIKASEDKYTEATNTKVVMGLIKDSIKLIMHAGIEYEFRTTAVPTLITSEEISTIVELIRGADKYVIQQFNPKKCLDKKYQAVLEYPVKKLEEFAFLARPYVKHVEVRNI